MYNPTEIVDMIPTRAADLEAEGWAPGAPPQIAEPTARIDAATCKRLRCPDCGRRGLEYLPYHNGARYRVVVGCPCGGAVEL
jgi:hypothetical protein